MATYIKTKVIISQLEKRDFVQLDQSTSRYQVIEIVNGTQVKLKNIITNSVHTQLNNVKFYRIDEKSAVIKKMATEGIPTSILIENGKAIGYSVNNEPINLIDHEQSK